jgi:hypothetical protein
MSRESLVQAYIDALPFSAVAIVAVPGGGCRIETCAPGAPGETIAQLYYFKPSHVDLVLGAAGLSDGAKVTFDVVENRGKESAENLRVK